MKTIGQSYLAAKIAVIDKLLSGCKQQPNEFNNAWHSARTALAITQPLLTEHELQTTLRACFPQLNTRWHA